MCMWRWDERDHFDFAGGGAGDFEAAGEHIGEAGGRRSSA